MPNQKQEWENWVASRPQIIRDLIEKYPPGLYRVNDDAPYGISCPGTIVDLHSYNESGQLGVVVTAENKLPAALEHERLLAIEHNRLKDLDAIHAANVKVYVDPIYLTLVEKHKMSWE